ncbi:hypothetical protein [Aquimarina brevivitae]|nr:hypothetical protein [Aquimarina brevivitae]
MNKIIPNLALSFLFCFALTSIQANENTLSDNLRNRTEIITKDSIATPIAKKKVKKPNPPVKTFRKFASLDKYDTPTIRVAPAVSKPKTKGFQFDGANAATNQDWLELAQSTFATIEENQNYIDVLTGDNLAQLPVAIAPKTISNTKYTVGIAKASFKPSYAELTAFLKVETARGTLILGAQDIKLSHDGGIVGEAKLNLISKFTININQEKILLTLNGSFSEPKTYATMDCDGFKELFLDADVSFHSDIIFPVNEDGKKVETKRLEGSFKTQVADWNDWVANVTLPEFGVKGLEGTTFKLNTAVLDFSDLRNDEAVPQDYINTYYSNSPNLWRGVYVESLKVLLPKAFKNKNSNERISFTGTKMIIDDAGVTGTFEGENILSIDEGSASKWQFSLDYFKVGLRRNSITEGAFNGEMILPVSKVGRLKYNAVIQPDEYTFQVSNTEDLDFDVWNAKVNLTPDSFVEMKIKDDEFRPKASLNGSVSISSDLKKESEQGDDKTVNFKGIVFEKMVIQTEAPKFSVEYFGYQGKQKLANFPVSLNEVGLQLSGEEAKLIVDFSVNLTSESDGGNGGGCRLAIKAKLQDEGGRERWKYDGIDLERLNVQMQVAGLELKGAIFIFEDDPTYGKGFAGALGAKFTMGMELEVEAKALFGRTDTYRYWYADAGVTLPTPIPIFTGFAINYFGGGFYNRMEMAGIDRSANGAFENIGTSISGVVYEPSEQNGFGMKASVGIITQNSEGLFNATLEFGISFRRSGGVEEVYFKGEGNLISSIPGNFYEKLTDKLGVLANGADSVIASYQPEGRIAANVFIKHDFVNDIFHATSELYVNLGFLKGIGPNGRAGWMDFYVGPDTWHILIGTPEDPIGTKLDIGILKEETRAYFMTGKDLPGSPPPPPMVAQLLGVDAAQLDYTRDLNRLDSGRGMAMGMHWAMSTGDLKFLIFYARFDAGFGFDIMLKDYGEAHCKGSSEPIGMGGWYANGQAYAYLQGHVGLKVKIFGKRKKINVFSGSGAVLVQARLPNPTWLRGYLKGKYKLLGGLVKGSFRFKVEVGNKCEVVGESALDGIVVIGDIQPKKDATNVDVFAAPQVSFNLPVNKVFELPDDTGDHKYKIILDKFETLHNGQAIEGEIEWGYGNDLATFYSHEILPPNSKLTGVVQVHFEEFLNGNWQVIKDNGAPATEIKEFGFETGEAPDNIPLSNIEYMYPVIDQQNFYIDQYENGYVKLKRGQSYLFDPVPDWEKSVTIKAETAAEEKVTFGYNAAQKQLSFVLPRNMELQSTYSLMLSLVPPGDQDTEDTTATYSTTKLDDEEEDGNTVSIRTNTISQLKVRGDERELLNFGFHTSEYKTFQKKIDAMRKVDDSYEFTSYPYGLTLSNKIDHQEPFDIEELIGTRFTGDQPLVVVRAVLNNKYYNDDIYPLIYENYPIAENITVDRDTEKVGIPPIEGVEPMTWYLTYLENDINTDLTLNNPYRYNLTYYFYEDYEDLVVKLANSNMPPSQLAQYTDLLSGPFPMMEYGDYDAEYKYILPGGMEKGRTKKIEYFNKQYGPN